MNYTVQTTRRLQGICITKYDEYSTADEFVITEVLDETLTATLDIGIGDVVLSLNDQPFATLMSESGFKDPTCVLWDTPLPFTLTLHRVSDLTQTNYEFEEMIKSPEPNLMEESECKTATKPLNINHINIDADLLFGADSPSEFEANSNHLMTSPVSYTSMAAEVATPHRPYITSFTSWSSLEDVPNHSMSIYEILCESNRDHSIPEILESAEMNQKMKCDRFQPLGISSGDLCGIKLISRYLSQNKLKNRFIHFDTVSMTKSNGRIIVLSSRPLIKGIHEWSLEITKCDVDIQEVGICSIGDLDDIDIHNDGVTETVDLGARAVYGSELQTDSVWYASFNENGKARCFRDLKACRHIRWTTKCKIKVVVDLNKWRIAFFMNGQKVQKLLSLQSNRPYHPFISFHGNCKYSVY